MTALRLLVVSLSDEPASWFDVGATHRSYVVNVTSTQPLVDVTSSGVVHVRGRTRHGPAR